MDLKGNPFYLTDAQVSWVSAALAAMSDREKAGQVFCALGDAYDGDKLDYLVGERHVGGVLFRPVRPTEEIARHFAHLDTLAKFPLFHAANLEEGGAGIAADGSYFACELQVAASGDNADCEHFARVCAAEGQKAGVNWTFSPVADIDMEFRNPITNCRTFGADPERVAEKAELYTKTLQARGMAACAKHFPGDGVDYRDQHLHPSYNSLSAERWRATYGQVYRRLIGAGLLSVMVGHIAQPALEMEHSPGLTFDGCMPASLSPGLLQGVLRGELGFNGLITTDATIMGGFTMAMPRERAIPTAIESGCDCLVFSTDIEEDMGFLLRGLETGLLSRRRLDEAVTRVLALKARVCVPRQPEPLPDTEVWRARCAQNAVTLVKDKGGILPLSAETTPRVRLALLGSRETPDGDLGELLAAALKKRGFTVEVYDPFADDLHGTAALPADRVTITALHYPPASNQTTVRVSWCPKHALEIPRFVHEEKHVFVSFANPYHLQDVPRAPVFVNAYTALAPTVEAVAAALCGEAAFKGQSPVDAFCGLPDTKL
ncbi:MAG: glycoside hydrolase family 3 protein [Oscillospiraceae bacterium]